MAAPEFELTPPEPILYLCKWCLDAGPQHLDMPHTCQKEWSVSSKLGHQKCECPCGEVYANTNRLLIYCSVLRIHASRAHHAMLQARRNARADAKSKRYYQRGYNALSLREEQWLDSENRIAQLRREAEALRASHAAATDELTKLKRRIMEDSRTISEIKYKMLAFKRKADAYDKLMEPMETTKGRHIILDDD